MPAAAPSQMSMREISIRPLPLRPRQTIARFDDDKRRDREHQNVVSRREDKIDCHRAP